VKFDVLTGEPVVTVELPAKTAVDRRILMLDNGPTIRPMLNDTGHPIEHHTDGHPYAKSLKCTHEECGADWHTLENHPSMRFVSPGAEPSYPSNPRYLHCTVCVGPIVRASGLFRALYPKNQAKHLDQYSLTRLHLRDYIAIRCDDRTAVGADNFQRVARLVASSQPSLDADFSALVIRACGLDVAEKALAFETFPFEAFKNVPVTFHLWPKARWHSQPMTATDEAGIHEFKKRQRREAAKSLENEVAAFRAELVSRQRALA
jgi:hypothetical protein